MLNKLKNRKQEGFTIIEVLIVLAIAGLILLIVFLAIPALQRNSRNTTLKADAGAFSSGIQEYVSNNDGQLPASIAVNTSGTITIGAVGSSQATAKINGGTTVVTAQATPSTFAAGTLSWKTGIGCDGTTNSRAVSVYYYVESAGTPSNTPKCVSAG